jgi:hypothetical protein
MHDRAGHVLDELALDLPDQRPPLLDVRFARLLDDQPLDLLIAVVGVVALGLAGVVLDEIDIRVVDREPGQVEAYREVAARDLAVPDVVSTTSSSDSMWIFLSWSIRITAGSR